MVEVKEYVTGFISAIIAVVIAVTLLPTLMTAMTNASQYSGLLATGLVGTIVGAGILLFILKIFI